ncbi:phosphatase PAP2 family protein [Lentilactobacillus raoultii]|uniref:Phosphatase PAP2 family protein n=1 Tax=Lentilactobacillus raoultii TaxID=1987503 RepID=A0ABW3PHY6_9LACO|nr:phosphatase PAP2 family protein [Lentilactobacillus raoultii]
MIRLRQPKFFLGSISLITFLIFLTGVLLHADWISTFDHQIGQLVRNEATPQLTVLAIHFTKLVNVVPVISFTIGVTLILALVGKLRAAAFLMINSLGLAGPINTLVKHLVNRPRPLLHHLVMVHSTSFPSGHSMSAMMIGGSLILIANRLLKKKSSRFIFGLLVGLLIGLVGLSRIYVGVHFASDVVGGWSLGLFLLLLSQFIFNRFLGGLL